MPATHALTALLALPSLPAPAIPGPGPPPDPTQPNTRPPHQPLPTTHQSLATSPVIPASSAGTQRHDRSQRNLSPRSRPHPKRTSPVFALRSLLIHRTHSPPLLSFRAQRSGVEESRLPSAPHPQPGRPANNWTHRPPQWTHSPRNWTHSPEKLTHRAKNWTHWPDRVDTSPSSRRPRSPTNARHRKLNTCPAKVNTFARKVNTSGQKLNTSAPKLNTLARPTEHTPSRTHPSASRPPSPIPLPFMVSRAGVRRRPESNHIPASPENLDPAALPKGPALSLHRSGI